MKGSINVFTGPMFSGKSTSLLAAADKHFHHDPESLFLFKPKQDNRYSEDEIVTHNNDKKKAIVVETSQEIVDYFLEEANKTVLTLRDFVLNRVEAVCIDEAMFFDDDEEAVNRDVNIVSLCVGLRHLGVDVYLALLNLDYNLNPFKLGKTGLTTGDLMCYANNVSVLHAVDTSFHKNSKKPVDADCTLKTGGGNDIFQVGGGEMYKPVNATNHPGSEKIADKVFG